MTSGNNGQPSVAVAIGTVQPLGVVTITFQVGINTNLPSGLAQVSNQGYLLELDDDIIFTDDPNTPMPNDPTVTPVTTHPILVATKAYGLINDADQNGVPSPGDTIGYTVTVANNGVTATLVTFSDIPDPNTTLVTGTVTTTQGTITSGNGSGDANVAVDIGTLGSGHHTFIITFDVVIDNPVPAGVTQVSNQGHVDSNELPTVFTDDPATVTTDDPTITPITAAPLLEATKRAVLFVDKDGDATPSPDDVLLYEVILANNGNANVSNAVFSDILDPNTSLISGTVHTTGGVITSGNNQGGTGVGVDIGTLAGGHTSVQITFQAHITSNMPSGVVYVSNQGTLTSTELASPLLTDDPDTPTIGDATRTPVDAPGLLTAVKQGALDTDADQSGSISPGDTLQYQVRISNIGGEVVTNVVFHDTLDPNTNLVIGSVHATTGTISSGNNTGDTSVGVAIGVIPVGQHVDISYRATITNPMPAGVISVTNQGVISSSQGITTTSDPTNPDPGPTVIPVNVTQNVQLKAAANAPVCVLPGSSYNVTWTISNTGNIGFAGVMTTAVIGSGSGSGPNTHTVSVSANGSSIVTRTVHVSQPVPYGAEVVTVTGSVLTSTAVLATVICAPDFRTSAVQVSSAVVFAGEQLTYTWQISNTGNADAFGVNSVLTMPMVTASQFFTVTDVASWPAGPAPTIDLANRRLVWHGNVLSGTVATIVFHARASFGFPHQVLLSPFDVTHPWRPPFAGKVEYIYPYRLFFMLVLNHTAP